MYICTRGRVVDGDGVDVDAVVVWEVMLILAF